LKNIIVLIQLLIKKKSSKILHKQNKISLINKKRKEENDTINGQINQKEKICKEIKIISEINSKRVDNGNAKKRKYIIDESFKNVVTVKQKDEILMAIVDKSDSNRKIRKTYKPTEKLRKTNPWILLNFYETKIIFSEQVK
jgi:hypothetical protein